MHFRFLVALVAVAGLSRGLSAGSAVEDLRKEVEDLRKGVAEKERATAAVGKLDVLGERKYGPNAPVTTKNGKLEIGGLLQLWNVSIDNDHSDVFSDNGAWAGSGGTSEAIDNNGYRIRRAELKFTMHIHENVTAHVMIDPAREATSFPGMPSNQGLFKSQRENTSVALGTPIEQSSPGRVAIGSGLAPRLLQDAYINFHGVVPHHDFTIGQFKPAMGEEGPRNSAYLDFAERAMCTQINDYRDLGAQVHGTWIDDRVQYWLGAFDGAGNYFGTAGDPNSAALGTFEFANRSDDNDQKDFLGSVLVRPIWNCGPWGSLELGFSGMFGRHGESGDGSTDFTAPVNGLNRRETAAIRQAAWGFYKPMGPVRGWWLRGEWDMQRDRTVPLSVNAFALGSGPFSEQGNPAPFTRQGWFFSTGYKLTDSVFAERLAGGGFWNNLLQPVEFAFRYETFENVVTEDAVNPDRHTDLFKTQVWTAGVNYYVKAYNMRVQVNYMVVDDPSLHSADGRVLREVKNNVFIFTYQVAF
jgi:hypothetical protein